MTARAGQIVIGIPTAGRAAILGKTITALSRQTRLPDRVLISVGNPEDSGEVETWDLPFDVEVLIGAKGLSHQRNLILNALQHDDILLYLDDDFLMAADYLARLETIFADHPDMVMTTGVVLADGIHGVGLDHAQGAALLAADSYAGPDILLPETTGYGCNMALRAAAILDHGIFFDERLPLYSWLEDADLSHRLRPFGRFARPTALRGVHLGVKTGRTSGVRLGYSQIANPVYMTRKGTLSRKRATRLMLRNFAANVYCSVVTKSWADHRGRLRGNLLALFDICIGRSDPRRILELGRRGEARRGYSRTA